MIATYGSTCAETRLRQMLEGAIGNRSRNERVGHLRVNPLTSNAKRLAGMKRNSTRWNTIWNYNRIKSLIDLCRALYSTMSQVKYLRATNEKLNILITSQLVTVYTAPASRDKLSHHTTDYNTIQLFEDARFTQFRRVP